MTINRINNKRTNKYIDEDEEQEENINNNNNNNNNEPVSNNSNNQLNIDDRPFIVNSNTETVLSINLNEFNSRNDLINYDQFLTLNNINSVNNINNNNNVNNNSNLTMPDITFITEAPAKIKRKTNTLNQKSPIKFTRNLLWFPLVACCLVVLMAIISGLSFVFLNYHIQQQQLLKNNKTYLIYINNNNNSISTFIDTSTSPTTSTLFVNKTLMNNNNLKETCGNPAVKPNLRQVRIIKGHDAVPHSWPWTVSIGYYGPKNIVAHACGGSLINKRTVVTATHCVVKESIYRLVGSPVPNSSLYGSVEAMMRIYIGINKRSTDINEKNTYFAIKILSFPGFNADTFQNDLTLITLDRDVEVCDDVSFICVSNQSNITPGTQVYAVGWGFTDGNFFRASDTLMQVKIHIQSFENCGLSYVPIFQFCAGNPELGKDTCNGDSGGPIMEYVNNRWILAGLVSNGDSGCTGRGVYTNIAFYYQWIIDNS